MPCTRTCTKLEPLCGVSWAKMGIEVFVILVDVKVTHFDLFDLKCFKAALLTLWHSVGTKKALAAFCNKKLRFAKILATLCLELDTRWWCLTWQLHTRFQVAMEQTCDNPFCRLLRLTSFVNLCMSQLSKQSNRCLVKIKKWKKYAWITIDYVWVYETPYQPWPYALAYSNDR